MTKTIYIISDKRSLLRLYRDHLIKLVAQKFETKIEGIFDSPLSFLKLLASLSKKNNYILSSNIKCNIFLLLHPFTRGLMIFNGLGRFREYPLFRYFIGYLIKNRCRTLKFVVQNYADFRYFRRYFSNDLSWVPGSGGRSFKSINRHSNAVIVTRYSKLITQRRSLINLIENLPSFNLKPIRVYGSGDLSSIIKNTDNPNLFKVCGWREVKDIYSEGKYLISLGGYGEGVPHNVVDAICSDFEVILHEQDFRRFGFHLMDTKFSEFSEGWRIVSFFEEGKKKVSIGEVNKRYVELLHMSLEK